MIEHHHLLGVLFPLAFLTFISMLCLFEQDKSEDEELNEEE